MTIQASSGSVIDHRASAQSLDTAGSGAAGEAEHRVNARRDREDRFPQAPPSAVEIPLAGAADVPPEIVKVVALAAVIVELRIFSRIADETAGARVLDNEKRHGSERRN